MERKSSFATFMMMMMFTYIKITRRGCHKIYTLYASIQTSQNGISTNKISMIIRNKGSINDNKAETKRQKDKYTKNQPSFANKTVSTPLTSPSVGSNQAAGMYT
jgi:hypothetical protein